MDVHDAKKIIAKAAVASEVITYREADRLADAVLAAFEDAGIVLAQWVKDEISDGLIIVPLGSLPDVHDATRGEGET